MENQNQTTVQVKHEDIQHLVTANPWKKHCLGILSLSPVKRMQAQVHEGLEEPVVVSVAAVLS